MTSGPDEKRVRVAVQQHHNLFRAGLALLLPVDRRIDLVGSVATSGELLNLCWRARPAADVALVDGYADPVDLAVTTAALRRMQPRLALVALCGRGHAGPSRHGIRVDAVTDRGAGAAVIVDTILSVAGRARAVPRAPSRPSGALSGREHDVLSLLGRGLTVRAIAERLAISTKTVEHHKRHIFAKLQTRNQAHAVSVALGRGLLRVDGLVEPH